jgi:hypothetical protein
MFAVVAVALGCVVVATPAGAVIDAAVVVPSPNAGTINDRLYSVSCVSASDCVAVGYTNTGSVIETLTMVWDGTVWSIVPSPSPGTILDALYSVSCVSASDCVAVGYTDSGNNIYETLVLSLTGPVPPSTTSTTVSPSTTTTVSPEQVVPAFTG